MWCWRIVKWNGTGRVNSDIAVKNDEDSSEENEKAKTLECWLDSSADHRRIPTLVPVTTVIIYRHLVWSIRKSKCFIFLTPLAPPIRDSSVLNGILIFLAKLARYESTLCYRSIILHFQFGLGTFITRVEKWSDHFYFFACFLVQNRIFLLKNALNKEWTSTFRSNKTNTLHDENIETRGFMLIEVYEMVILLLPKWFSQKKPCENAVLCHKKG